MHLRMTLDEVLSLVPTAALPPAITEIRSTDDGLHLDVDLRHVEADSLALRVAARATAVIDVQAAFGGFDPLTQIVTLTLTATARGLPAHKILSLLTGPANKAIDKESAERGLPGGLATLVSGSPAPHVKIDIGALLEHAADTVPVRDIQVRSLDVSAGEVALEATWNTGEAQAAVVRE